MLFVMIKKGHKYFSYNFFVLVLVFYFALFFQKGIAQCAPPAASNCDPTHSNSAIIMDTQTNYGFTFDSFSKYSGGITYNGATILKVKVAANVGAPHPCKWKLVMIVSNGGPMSTPVTSEWETLVSYGLPGGSSKPSIDLISVKVNNGCSTPANAGIWQQFAAHDGAVLAIIDSPLLNSPGFSTACSGGETNGEGTYLGADYNEYSFTVDYRITPGYNYEPGQYQIFIKFCLVEA